MGLFLLKFFLGLFCGVLVVGVCVVVCRWCCCFSNCWIIVCCCFCVIGWILDSFLVILICRLLSKFLNNWKVLVLYLFSGLCCVYLWKLIIECRCLRCRRCLCYFVLMVFRRICFFIWCMMFGLKVLVFLVINVLLVLYRCLWMLELFMLFFLYYVIIGILILIFLIVLV